MRVGTRTYVDKDLSGLLVRDEFEYWEGWFAEWNDRAPAEAKGVQTSTTWPRMKTELAFISGTLMSLLVSIVIVSLSILLFTGNVWLMGYTTVVIASIVLSLMGWFVVWGWPLGALEAISVPLVVGLSVDYCLHLSHAYTAAAEVDGEEKGKKGGLKVGGTTASARLAQTRRALLRIGPSITAASVTTIACMSVLLWCRIVVFVQFGIIVGVTLTMGLVFTMTAFLATLQVAGPYGKQGDVRVAGKRAYGWLKRRVDGRRGVQMDVVEEGEDEEEKQGAEDGDDVREQGSVGRGSRLSLEQRGLGSSLLS